VLVDRAGRALLPTAATGRPEQSWWFTPGGGLDGDETPAEGAARELARRPASGSTRPTWATRSGTRSPSSATRPALPQDQDFFLLRVSEVQVDTAGMDEDEQQTITEHRWWSAAGDEASDEQIYPRELPGLLRRFAVRGPGGR
jgi:hypothetical protein